MLSFTTAEDASQRFATAHGFRHTSTTRISGVDPRTVEPPSAPPGVDLRPLASLNPRKVYELDAEAMLDVPGEVAMDDVSFSNGSRTTGVIPRRTSTRGVRPSSMTGRSPSRISASPQAARQSPR